MVCSEAREVLLQSSHSARVGTEKAVMEQLEWVLGQLGTPVNTIADIKSMAAEACLNAIEHGCQFDEACGYEVELIRQGRELVLLVRDNGGHDPNASRLAGNRAGEEGQQRIDQIMQGDAEPRGWGLVMIDALSDSWTLKGNGKTTELEIHVQVDVTGREYRCQRP